MKFKNLFICFCALFLCFEPLLKAQENKDFEILKNLEIFSSAYKELELNYVDELKPGDLIKTALDAMLSSLDPYTNYIPEADIEDYKILTLGQYGGIGSVIQYRDSCVYIAEPYEGFPADKAGLIPGDRILEINGENTFGRSISDVSALLKGQAGTKLRIKLERKGKKSPFEVEITRQEIKIDNVPYSGMLKDSIGYIRLDGFTSTAADEFRTALLSLKASGAKKLIIDLRYNGGGLLNEAVKIANFFCKKGLAIVSTKAKTKERSNSFYTTNEPIDTEIPIVILSSRATASASEILAGSLQDYDRCVIMGQRSFGKGLVQNILPLPYNSQIKLTVSKYYIPSGRCVQAIDYSNKQDGKAQKIPDSLRTAFKTKGGRIVYDGDGIEPDVELESETASEVLPALITQFHIFDYASYYKERHASIGSLDSFDVETEVFEDFLSFMKERNFSFKIACEMALDDFSNIAKEDSIFSDVENLYKDLRAKIEELKKDDIIKEKKNICALILSEIASRYYYQKGRAQAELRYDPWLVSAIEMLNDTERYSGILKGE